MTTTTPTSPTSLSTSTRVNPWAWQDRLGFSQGVVVDGPHRTLYAAGQGSIDAEGLPQHDGDMAAQTALAMDNVETVLAAAGMTLADVVRYDVYTTDVDRYFAEGAAQVAGRFAVTGGFPAGGICTAVPRLAFPPMLVEVTVTACR